MKAATKALFGALPAILGETVILRPGSDLLVGKIEGIDEKNDVPQIITRDGSLYSTDLKFVPTKTAQDIDEMPRGTWTRRLQVVIETAPVPAPRAPTIGEPAASPAATPPLAAPASLPI